MQLDAMTLSALADELSGLISGARVDDVIAPTPHSIALRAYRGGKTSWLLISAHPSLARIHLLRTKPRKLSGDASAWVMLLRKHLEGARLVELHQPKHERIVSLAFTRAPDRAAWVWLTCELMGKMSNLILHDSKGIILGALRTVPAGSGHSRVITPHAPYIAPPPQIRLLHGNVAPRLDPAQATGAQLATAAFETEGAATQTPKRGPTTVADLLLLSLAGWSRPLGREVAARALGNPAEPVASTRGWDGVARETRALAEMAARSEWEPTLISRATQPDIPVDGTVFLPRQFGAGYVLRPAESVNELVAGVMHAAEWEAEIEDVRRPLRQALRSHLQRSERKAVALAEELHALDGATTFREEADLLMAFASEVPAHVAQMTLENPFAVDGAPQTATLTLDPRFDAIENANRRYARYHKLQRAAKLIPPQITANEITRAQVEQLLTDLALAETRGEIEAARAGIEAAGYLRNRQERRRERIVKKKPGKQPKAKATPGGTPLRRQSADGFTLLVGKNSLQNEAVTFDMATGNDLWLHARGVPGAHVIVKSGGRPVPERTLREAAALAAWYSQGRGNSAVAVDATEQRYVRHLRGGGPGMVTYERERTIRAEPADPWAEG